MMKFVFNGVLFLGLCSFAFSQEKDTMYTLPGLEINSTRRTTTSYNEPLAISVVNAKELSKGRGYGLDEALSFIPGVFAQSRYGNQDIRITIRGFGARGAGERSNSGTSRGIRIMLDGFPETEPDGRTSFDHIDLSTMNKIEVIRSNSSALWGNGAGGLVSVSSNTNFERPFVSVQSSIGSFGFNKNLLLLGTDIGNGKFFLNLSNTNSDGWREHSQSTQTLLNTGIVSPIGERTNLGVYILGTSNLFHIPGPLSQKQFDSDPSQAQSDTSYYSPTYVKRDERRFNRLGRIGIALNHSLDDRNNFSATAYVNPKYLQRSERNTFRDFTRYHVGGSFVYRNSTSFTEGISGTTTIGTDEAYQDGAILFYQLKNGQRDSVLADNKREGANSFGLFIQEDVNLNENIILSVGARYDNVTYIAENFITPTLLSDKKSFTKISPKAGIVYKINPTQSIYASFGSGVEVPAGNETDPAQGQPNSRSINPLLEPIVSTTYELGTKQFKSFGSGFIQNVSYDAAAYFISTTNDIVPYQNGRFYLSAGETQRKGIELGVNAQFDLGLSWTTSLTVSNNTYSDYTIDSVYTKRPIALSLSGKSISYNGNNITGMPGLMVHNRLRYDATFLTGFFAEITSQSVGKYFADDANKLNVPAYTIFNTSFGYSGRVSAGSPLTLNAYITINNVTDVKYVSSAYINPDYGRVATTAKEAIYLEPGFPHYIVASVGLGYTF
ncbi:MAG: TonB-dependent receptor [Bacteroidota bacterium]